MTHTNILIITALENELDPLLVPKRFHIAHTGAGKINAALGTLKAIQAFQPKLIINFGTAGKINKQNPELAGLVEIAHVVQRDMMAEPLAPRGRVPFSSQPFIFSSQHGFAICGTGDSFVTAPDSWLFEQNIDLVDMELFGIASAAYDQNLPWRAFKYITDDANANAGKEWTDKINHGQDAFLKTLNEIN